MRIVMLAILLVFLGAAAACRMHDYRRAAVDVPEMKNRACAARIVQTLSRIPGIQADKIQVDLKRRRVVVVYNSLELGFRNIEFAIREAGFSANDVVARPEAVKALPPECTTGETNVEAPPVSGTPDVPRGRQQSVE